MPLSPMGSREGESEEPMEQDMPVIVTFHLGIIHSLLIEPLLGLYISSGGFLVGAAWCYIFLTTNPLLPRGTGESKPNTHASLENMYI